MKGVIKEKIVVRTWQKVIQRFVPKKLLITDKYEIGYIVLIMIDSRKMILDW